MQKRDSGTKRKDQSHTGLPERNLIASESARPDTPTHTLVLVDRVWQPQRAERPIKHKQYHDRAPSTNARATQTLGRWGHLRSIVEAHSCDRENLSLQTLLTSDGGRCGANLERPTKKLRHTWYPRYVLRARAYPPGRASSPFSGLDDFTKDKIEPR